MKNKLVKLLCLSLLFSFMSFIAIDLFAGGSITARNKCRWWRIRYKAQAHVSHFYLLYNQWVYSRGCNWATAEARGNLDCSYAIAVTNPYSHYVWGWSKAWFCGWGESFIPPLTTPDDSAGMSEGYITAKPIIGGRNFAGVVNIDGYLKAAKNTNFGAVFRVIVWSPQDDTINGTDTIITSDKILWEASVRIENGQLITTGGFSQNDFSLIFTDEEITVFPTNQKKMVRFAKAIPSERIRHRGIKLDIERDIKQPLLLNNPRNVPVEVINNVNVDNIAVTIMAEGGYGTYVDIYAPPPQARLSNASQNNPLDNIIDEKAVFNFYPQPATDKINIVFKVPETENVLIEIFNNQGKLVHTLFNGVANKEEEYLVEFNTSNLPKGLFISRFVSETSIITKKLIIIN